MPRGSRRWAGAEKVEGFRLQARKHFIDCLHGFAFPVFRGPEFARQPDFLPLHAAFPHRFADALFVKISVGGINVAAAVFQRFQNVGFRLFIGDVECADSNLGDFQPVVQCYRYHMGFLLSFSCGCFPQTV